MTNDIVFVLAILCNAGVLTKTEAKELREEVAYTNVPSDFDLCYEIVNKAFVKLRIGKEKATHSVTVDGKDVDLTK